MLGTYHTAKRANGVARHNFGNPHAEGGDLVDGLLGTATGIFRENEDGSIGELLGIHDIFNFDDKKDEEKRRDPTIDLAVKLIRESAEYYCSSPGGFVVSGGSW